MNREINAIRLSALVLIGFGFITLFEKGVFIPLLPGVDIVMVVLSFLFAFWNWKDEKKLSVGAIFLGIGFLGASFSILEIIFSPERLSQLNKTLLFDYLLIAKAIFVLIFGILCAIESKTKQAKLLFLIGGIGMCCSLLFSAFTNEWFLVVFSGICTLPFLFRWEYHKTPYLWIALFIFQLMTVVTTNFIS